MATKISTVTPMDAWVIARVVKGYRIQPSEMKATTPLVATFANWLLEVNPVDRMQAVQMNLTADAYSKVATANPDGRCPNDQHWMIIHANDLDKLPPLRWLIEHEIPEGGLTVVFGESGVGKSFLVLDYALRIAQEHPVVYIPTESESGYRKRVQAWCKHHGKGRGNLNFLLGSFTLLEREILGLLIADLQPISPKLIVVDTLAMAMAGGDENSQRDMGILLRSCRALTYNLSASVLLVHHLGKTGVRERGSSALRGNADTMIQVNPADDVISVECSKTKDEKPFETRYMRLLPVDLEDGENSLVIIPAEKVIRQKGDPLTPNQAKILDFLSLEVNFDGVTVRELQEVTGMALGTVMRTLDNLKRCNYVHKPKGSYAITDEGLIAIGKSDRIIDRTNSEKLADDRTDRIDRSDSAANSKNGVRSVRSTRSSLNLRDQRRDQDAIMRSDDDDDDPTQEALFPTPSVNQYNWRGKGRK